MIIHSRAKACTHILHQKEVCIPSCDTGTHMPKRPPPVYNIDMLTCSGLLLVWRERESYSRHIRVLSTVTVLHTLVHAATRGTAPH